MRELAPKNPIYAILKAEITDRAFGFSERADSSVSREQKFFWLIGKYGKFRL